jgi:hypothetical protein
MIFERLPLFHPYELLMESIHNQEQSVASAGITWAQLAIIIEKGQSELKISPFEFLSAERTPHSSSGIALNHRADVACRYFAAYQTWPVGLTTSEKRLLVRRVLFALSIIQAMKASGGAHLPDSQLDLDPSTRKPKDVLEWLLIQIWKRGGPKIMTHFEEILQTC